QGDVTTHRPAHHVRWAALEISDQACRIISHVGDGVWPCARSTIASVAIVHVDQAILSGDDFNLLPPDKPGSAQPGDEQERMTGTVIIIVNPMQSNLC